MMLKWKKTNFIDKLLRKKNTWEDWKLKELTDGFIFVLLQIFCFSMNYIIFFIQKTLIASFNQCDGALK